MISSLQNAKVKQVRQLTGRTKERREAGAFLAEGVRLVEEALAAAWPFRFALYTDGLSVRGKTLVERLVAAGVDVEPVSESIMKSVSETEAAQGLLAVLDQGSLPLPASLDFVLIPDRIRDPGNLGSLLRTAAAAGVQAVLLPPETTDAFAPKVVRAGMGSHFHLPIRSMSWDDIERLCTSAGLRVFLATMEGAPCWTTDFRPPLALIVGGEADGASERARAVAIQPVGIPMPGAMESLNAGAAGTILLFEVVRQRRTS